MSATKLCFPVVLHRCIFCCFSETAEVSVVNPAVSPLDEHTSELRKANKIIDKLMKTSPEVICLMEQSLENITECERSPCEYFLTEKFEEALRQGGISPEIACRFAQLMAYNTVRDVGCSASNGALFFIFT